MSSSFYRIPKRSTTPAFTEIDLTAPQPSPTVGTLIARTPAKSPGATLHTCCIALLMDDGTIVRPISKDAATRPFWSSNATAALTEGTRVRYSPTEGPPTELPHSTEDRYAAALQPDEPATWRGSMYALLEPHKRELPQVWPKAVRTGRGGETRAVVEAANVPSLAIFDGVVSALFFTGPDSDKTHAVLQVSGRKLVARVTSAGMRRELESLPRTVASPDVEPGGRKELALVRPWRGCMVLGLARISEKHYEGRSTQQRTHNLLLVGGAAQPPPSQLPSQPPSRAQSRPPTPAMAPARQEQHGAPAATASAPAPAASPLGLKLPPGSRVLVKTTQHSGVVLGYDEVKRRFRVDVGGKVKLLARGSVILLSLAAAAAAEIGRAHV